MTDRFFPGGGISFDTGEIGQNKCCTSSSVHSLRSITGLSASFQRFAHSERIYMSIYVVWDGGKTATYDRSWFAQDPDLSRICPDRKSLRMLPGAMYE